MREIEEQEHERNTKRKRMRRRRWKREGRKGTQREERERQRRSRFCRSEKEMEEAGALEKQLGRKEEVMDGVERTRMREKEKSSWKTETKRDGGVKGT